MKQITYHCPLCNGYTTFQSSCPNCQQNMVDYGPSSFLLANYSPYRPIEEMKRNDGWNDVLTHQCPHEIYCPNCGFEQIVLISEKRN